MNKSQKQKSQKNKKRVKKSENTKLTGTESSPVPEDETTDNEQENQTVTDKKVIVLESGTFSSCSNWDRNHWDPDHQNKRQQMPAGREVFQVVCQNMS